MDLDSNFTPISENSTIEVTQHFDKTELSSSTSSKSVPGRKKNKFTFILEQFTTSNKRYLKNEYFNIFIIRLIHKTFKLFCSYRVPNSGSIKIDIHNCTHIQIWSKISMMFALNLIKFDNILKVLDKKNYSKKIIEAIYKEDIIKEVYFLILKLLFTNSNPDSLCERLNLLCCKKSHSEYCDKKWADLKIYLETKYLADFDREFLEKREFKNTIIIPNVIKTYQQKVKY